MQPTIYTASDHHIRPQHLDKDALYILAKLSQAGYKAYLVGGGVRDLLMGKTPKDFDIATSAKPEEIKQLFSNCLLIGRRFRLAHIRFGKKIIEVSTFRSGDNGDSELILRDNDWGTEEQDVLRRDFTLNGLYYDHINNSIIDYVGGCIDLKKHLLRSIGTPAMRFKQDPVRMIRLLKFKARFGFNIEEETLSALYQCKEELQKSAPARVLEEFLKMLESGSAAPFLSLLAESGFLKILFPRLHHHEKMFDYLKVIDHVLQKEKHAFTDRSIFLASLFFPLLEDQVRPEAKFQEIIHTTERLLDDSLASAFFPLPKRLRHLTQFILNAQYRLTPPNGKKPISYRLTHHPDYIVTLQFLYIRSIAYPQLQEAFLTWKEHKPKKTPYKAPSFMIYSVVIPIKNESENIAPLINELQPVMNSLGKPWELIMVEDGSTDDSLALLRSLRKKYAFLRVLVFAKNAGQSSAFDAGFKAARGEYVITLDGDGQNDPADIPALIAVLENADLVCGVRLERKDPLSKKLISRLSNFIRSRVCQDKVQDTGCSLKIYRKKCLSHIKMYNGMHRFLPALFAIEGFRVKEVPVSHRNRTKGKSNYHFFNRSLSPLMDMFFVAWMRKRHLNYIIREEL